MTVRFDLRLPADVRSVGAARHAVRDELNGLVDDETLMDIELLVSELVTNGVRHGPHGHAWIDVQLRSDAGGITVEVGDAGAGFDPQDVSPPSPWSAGGWGLTLVDRLADRWGTRRAGEGSKVWFRIERLLAV